MRADFVILLAALNPQLHELLALLFGEETTPLVGKNKSALLVVEIVDEIVFIRSVTSIHAYL
jgi:hypothetical protein